MVKYFEDCGFIKEIVKEELVGKFKKIPKAVKQSEGCCDCLCGNAEEPPATPEETKLVDEDGRVLTEDEVADDTMYVYTRDKDPQPNGGVVKEYHRIVTFFKEEGGATLDRSFGKKDKKEIAGYTFNETNELPNGDVEHIYTKDAPVGGDASGSLDAG